MTGYQCEIASPVCLDDAPVAIVRGQHACSRCIEFLENREPSDDQIMNGPNVEGGVRFTRDERTR